MVRDETVKRPGVSNPWIEGEYINRKLKIMAGLRVHGFGGYLVQRVIEQIKRKEIHYDKGNRVFNPFPQVTELDDRCIRFLTSSKNFLQSLAEVFNIFYNTEYHGPHFHKIRDILCERHGSQNLFYQWVKDNEPIIKHIIELRNAQEHPKESLKLNIENFTVIPGNKIKLPEWQLSGCRKQPIDVEMLAIVKFLLEFSELFLIFCVRSSDKLPVPLILSEIPEKEIKKDCPIRYEPQIDMSKLKSSETK